MKPSVKIIMSVGAADVEAANVIAAQMDYEPESEGAFFGGYGDPVSHYVTELGVRPWTRDAIVDLIADGGTPESFILHEEGSVEEVILSLGL